MASYFGTQVSTFVFGLLFIFLGIAKTIRLNGTLHREMLKTFKNFTDVSPLRFFGVKASPQLYMQSTGVCELILGTSLIVGGRTFKKLACLGIMALMLLTAYYQLVLHDYTALYDLEVNCLLCFLSAFTMVVVSTPLLEESSGEDTYVLSLIRQYPGRLPTFPTWCLITMTPCALPGRNPCVMDDGGAECKWMDRMVGATVDLMTSVVPTSRFYNPLNAYLKKAHHVVMHMHLELCNASCDHSLFPTRLNQYFPADEKDQSIKRCRLKYAQLVISKQRTERYLKEKWLPKREEELENLRRLAHAVAMQISDTIFDRIGTPAWKSIDRTLVRLNTTVSTYMREYFRNLTQCNEADILLFVQSNSTESIPSEIF